MGVFIRRIIFALIFFLLTGAFFVQKANAASLVNVSDTLTNSRPSAAAPLSAPLLSGAGQAQIFDNGSIFLASDSAVILKDAANETSDVGLNVASMSATAVPSATNRIVYFTNTTGSAHHQGVALVTPVTAKHTIQFTTTSTIPASGKIIITFPGAGSNTASPSATGFSFNNLANTNVTFSGTGVSCTSITVSSPTITCNQNSGGGISSGTTITAVIGSTTPQLINPTKTAVAGTADSWKITIQTQDNNSVNLDYGALRAATIEAVQVQATVEPTITFTIAGVANSSTTSFSSLGASGCGAEFANTGIDSTATNVNLGLLNNGAINRVAQTLTVSTNGAAGYAITATSSGRFLNPTSGFWLADANGGNGLTANDTPRPLPIATNTAAFGVSPCGARVPVSIWGISGTIVANSNFTNPWNTGTNSFSATIASWTGGPVSNDVTVARYAAAVSGTTPAGIYVTNVSYVATATF